LPTGPSHYVSNRDPLLPSALVKLPIGSITPKGWLRKMLELEAQGMTGRLTEISKWCDFQNNAWASVEGKGHSGWEELPYWLKGYGDLGYVLKDEKIIKEARKWIERVLASQDATGWFGPRELQKSLGGKPDLWPHMVMLNVLQSYYEVSADERVLKLMTNYFRWELNYPEKDFLVGYWPHIRAGDNLESVYWLYNRTGDKWLLDLGQKIHRRMKDWTTGVHDWHNVNVSQAFREPGVYYIQAKTKNFLDAAERNYQTVMGLYGQFPGGTFAGDENCRPGFGDPHQGFETCGIVEFMHSFEMLTKISGNPLWSDRCEDLAFNSFPASMTPDQKGLHYLTCANQVQLDKANHAPGIQNGGCMFAYSAWERYRCCQHNVSHGWPYYAEELWLATADKGLCASLYAASEVEAKVGDEGATVKIASETDYPFSDTIQLKIAAGKPVKFPLYLRVPRWCAGAQVKVNGQAADVKAAPLSYVVVRREWRDGDTLTLRLPMQVAVKKWEKNKNAVSVDYGPLTFSLKIGERWQKSGAKEKWPEWEVFPTTAWNYGLVLDGKTPAESIEVARKPGAERVADMPFTVEAAPIELRAKAKKVPGWKLDRHGLVAALRPSPVQSDEPLETVTLIPMGCARLRITMFPQIGGPDAQPWAAPANETAVSASHCFENDTLDALCDNLLPKVSNDHSVPRMTFWPRKGSTEWVQYDFPKPRKVSAVEVYWFDDTGLGQCRVPQAWQVLFKEGDQWKPVPGIADGPGSVKRDSINRAAFPPITTASLRLEVRLQKDFSAGILEWRVKEVAP
jgi:hypothetical protein